LCASRSWPKVSCRARSAGFAFGLVWALKIIIANLLGNHPQNLISTFRVTSADALGIGFLVLAIGAAIGVIGSVVGLRRFLEG
jgi:cell division protein FtsX